MSEITSRWTGGPYYLTPEQRKRTREMFQRKAKRKEEEQSSSGPAKILYLCDRRRCDNCSEDCRLTSDIRHAENFIKYNDVFWEKEAAEEERSMAASCRVGKRGRGIMDRQLYSVIDDNGNHIAYHLELRNALILIHGLMLEYYNEPCLTYRIMREQAGCEDVNITESEVEE